ncbi:MAG TPA: zinc ABC transporter substrate-binding protein [Roseiarcus sp.]|nr:zinc ABC transporter substrate-binding protein [Roseiarcus sp.]
MIMKTLPFAGAVLAAAFFAGPALADPVNIVAAENFYGDVATQIGGANVAVTSILSNPDEDPHLFEASASTAKALAAAKIVIVNGVDYDLWIEKLLKANKSAGRKEILVAALAGKKAGANPHLWYSPATMAAVAKTLSADLATLDPARKADYDKGAAAFADSLKGVDDKVADMRKKYAGQPVAASEPVFGYMAELLGLKVQEEKFALAIMNNTEPSASDVAAFENDLKGHKVKVMLYNAQASEPAVQRLVQIAKDQKIPVVGVSETEPANSTYQQWMMSQLDALDQALTGPTQ